MDQPSFEHDEHGLSPSQDRQVLKIQHKIDRHKASSRSSPSAKKRSHPIREFILDLFIEKSCCKLNQQEFEILLKKEATSVRSIHLNHSKQIPDLDGYAFSIEDSDMDQKCHAVHQVLQAIEKKLGDAKSIDLIFLIPEGIVSYLIGSQGRQINSIMQETQTTIVVNQPIHKFPPRTVKISGPSQHIFNAVKIITQKITERGVTEEDYKIPEPLDASKIHTKAKLLYPDNVCDYIDRYKDEIEQMESEYSVKMKIRDNYRRIKGKQHQKKDELVIVIEGKLKNIQNCVQGLIKKIDNHFSRQRGSDIFVKIIMPSSYASKLIGAKGCLIRELANKSKGAQIKVLSERDAEADSGKGRIKENIQLECIVQVGGTVSNKYEAAVLILEQIECFKNGGPVIINNNNNNQ